MNIAEENLEILIKNNKVLFRESFGGNGGFYNGYPCAGLNINIDKFGKITYIGNEGKTNYILRICLIKENNNFYTKIVGIYRNINENKITRIIKVEDPKNTAEENLIKTKELYNQKMKK